MLNVNLQQGQPAFILKTYHIAKYLEPVKIQGKNQRDKQAKEGKVDRRLLPLTPSELLYASALGMYLADVSDYVRAVRSFLNMTAEEEAELEREATAEVEAEAKQKAESDAKTEAEAKAQANEETVNNVKTIEEKLKAKMKGKIRERTKQKVKKKVFAKVTVTPGEEDGLWRLLSEMDKCRDLRHKTMTEPQLVNLTKYLLYQAKSAEIAREMDILIVLPLSRHIIGRLFFKVRRQKLK